MEQLCFASDVSSRPIHADAEKNFPRAHLFVFASPPGYGLGVGQQVLHVVGRAGITEVEFACEEHVAGSM